VRLPKIAHVSLYGHCLATLLTDGRHDLFGLFSTGPMVDDHLGSFAR
jgi:hypothetical protein